MAPVSGQPFTRSANACDTCRQRKVKCSGSRPCQACVRRGLDCEFGFVGRRGYSEAYVQRLLETIQTQDERLKTSPPPSGSGHSRKDSSASRQTSPEDESEMTDPPEMEGDGDEPKEGVAGGPEMTSGPAFESRVRSIIREHAGTQPFEPSPTSSTTLLEPFEGSSGQLVRTRNSNLGTSTPPVPSKEESFRLFDVFISWMGANQHFLDPRSFFDSMDMLYQDEQTRNSRMQTMWFSQYLLVMAMGKLIGCGSGGLSGSAGVEYFNEAMDRLPPSHEMGSYGIISVEILCLASLYLQWCDRKNDAYLYIGSAVRLALALGCALPFSEQQGLSSERWHRTRVWWTAYILDRRASAALGLPMGADERQIRADLPKPAPGFDDPKPLIINVKIARNIGEIMSSFYGTSTPPQGTLVKRLESTLQSLYETQRSIPSQYVIDFEKPRITVTRTGASLYLLLFQAIILCVRPMILQRVKDRIECTRGDRPQPAKSPAMTRLCHSCRDAAIKTIRVLNALRHEQDHNRALFGCFDLDATFSAAFILVMKGFLDMGDLTKPPEGLRQAADVLQYLSKAGNKGAEKRLEELRQFCYHVWSPDNMSEEWGWLKGSYAARPLSTISPSVTGGGPATVGSSSMSNTQITDQPSTPLGQTTPGMAGWTNWQGDPGAWMDLDNFQMDLNMEMGDIYSCYNDPSLPLTGIDEVDWQEVGKMFSLNEA